MNRTSQLSPESSPARIYEECFVPALFGQWGKVIANVADIRPGQRILDVACGTGTLTCAVFDRLSGTGSVTGLDINDDMLAVARGKNQKIEWLQGHAESLPFKDDSFDAVVSQFGLMFFEDRVKALQEALRVLAPGGHLVVAVCDALDHSPGYAVLSELLHRLFGEAIAEAFRAPFSCGDWDMLRWLCQQADIPNIDISRVDGAVTFSSIDALVSTERACVWTLGGLLDDSQFDRLAAAAKESLEPFLTPDRDVSFTMPVLIIHARK